MFMDDIQLCREVVERHGPLLKPVIDVGGLADPTIADYSKTLAAMHDIPGAYEYGMDEPRVRAAQYARYQKIHRPLSFIDPDYIIENPENGGRSIEDMYAASADGYIGTAILLSVLEHVRSPFVAIRMLRRMMLPGGLIIVSVPFSFPYHPSPEDNFRFTPSGLRAVFEDVSNDASYQVMRILECDWRLRIPADAGVRCIRTGSPQAVESCYVVARAVRVGEGSARGGAR